MRIQEKTDEELMVDYKKGDEMAFEILFLRYNKRIFNLFMRYFNDQTIAEDLFQTTFLKIHRSRGQYNPEYRFSTWLYSAAINLCKDEVKKKARTREVQLFDSSEKYLSKDKNGFENVTEKNEVNKAIKEAIGTLPESQRKAFLLSRYDGLAYAEIAKILQRSQGAVKLMIYRANRSLKERLKRFRGVT